MTHRSRWLILLGISGLALGLLRSQHTLAWLSLTVLFWLFVEWSCFYYRLWFEIPRLKIRRVINGRSDTSGFLWAGRRVAVEIHASLQRGSLGPLVTVRDCMPENLSVESGNCETELLTRANNATFAYEARVCGAGNATLPGFRITIQDPQGLFLAERFVPCEHRFRVLPAYVNINETQPIVKRINSLPQHGIHRLQRAGLGSELLELREYVPGDPPKSIAWKVSARRETLMTRQYESEVPVRLRLFVDGSISARIGGFGMRLLDQMTFVAASVARSAISVGDPVGAVLFDERGSQRIPPAGGERGFYRLLEALSDFANNPPPPQQRYSLQLLGAVHRLCGERFPELMESRVNQVPFTFLPLSPMKRRDRYQRTQVASVLADVYDLTPVQVLELVHDDNFMARYAQKLLSDSGISWMDPLVQTRDRGFHDGMATMELLSKALAESVANARDNEVYVVMANLLECATNISHLLPAVKMALARHHRVVFIVPTPTFRRPANEDSDAQDVSVDSLLERAEDIRTKELSSRLQRSLHRIGARVSLSGEESAIRMVLAETDLARSGRLSTTGGRN